MAVKKAANGNGNGKRTRERVDLPLIVESEEASWPGQTRNSNNTALRDSLALDVEKMEYGSVRRYNIAGDKQQVAFLNLFRSVVSNVWDGEYGVSAVKRDDHVIVRLGDKVTRKRAAKK